MPISNDEIARLCEVLIKNEDHFPVWFRKLIAHNPNSQFAIYLDLVPDYQLSQNGDQHLLLQQKINYGFASAQILALIQSDACLKDKHKPLFIDRIYYSDDPLALVKSLHDNQYNCNYDLMFNRLARYEFSELMGKIRLLIPEIFKQYFSSLAVDSGQMANLVRCIILEICNSKSAEEVSRNYWEGLGDVIFHENFHGIWAQIIEEQINKNNNFAFNNLLFYIEKYDAKSSIFINKNLVNDKGESLLVRCLLVKYELYAEDFIQSCPLTAALLTRTDLTVDTKLELLEKTNFILALSLSRKGGLTDFLQKFLKCDSQNLAKLCAGQFFEALLCNQSFQSPLFNLSLYNFDEFRSFCRAIVEELRPEQKKEFWRSYNQARIESESSIGKEFLPDFCDLYSQEIKPCFEPQEHQELFFLFFLRSTLRPFPIKVILFAAPEEFVKLYIQERDKISREYKMNIFCTTANISEMITGSLRFLASETDNFIDFFENCIKPDFSDEKIKEIITINNQENSINMVMTFINIAANQSQRFFDFFSQDLQDQFSFPELAEIYFKGYYNSATDVKHESVFNILMKNPQVKEQAAKRMRDLYEKFPSNQFWQDNARFTEFFKNIIYDNIPKKDIAIFEILKLDGPKYLER